MCTLKYSKHASKYHQNNTNCKYFIHAVGWDHLKGEKNISFNQPNILKRNQTLKPSP